MKANEKYFTLTRRIAGYTSNYGLRINLAFPAINAWTFLVISAGIRRSKLMQYNPVRFVWLRSCKGIQIGFGLVHFTLVYHS